MAGTARAYLKGKYESKAMAIKTVRHWRYKERGLNTHLSYRSGNIAGVGASVLLRGNLVTDCRSRGCGDAHSGLFQFAQATNLNHGQLSKSHASWKETWRVGG
jgi:hypothetical protein